MLYEIKELGKMHVKRKVKMLFDFNFVFVFLKKRHDSKKGNVYVSNIKLKCPCKSSLQDVNPKHALCI